MSAESQETFEYENRLLSLGNEKWYLNEKRADFYFIIKSPDGMCERLPAHKLLLSASDVLETMFDGKWKETNEATMGNATIAAFKEFLQFFYLSRVKLTKENVGTVMGLGHMYNVTECVNACTEFMVNTTNDENVCWTYEYAMLYDREELKKYCEIVISNGAAAVLKSKSFLDCDRKTVSQIVKMDSLHCSEVELFEACLAWVKSATQQDQLTTDIVKEYLGDTFNDIRFGLMSLMELAAIDFKNKIFTLDEHREILQFQLFGSVVNNPVIFNGNREKRSKPIQLDTDKIVCSRETQIGRLYEPYYIQAIEITLISTNKPIMLAGFDCGQIDSYDDEYDDYDSPSEEVESQVTIVEIRGPTQSGERVTVYNGNTELERYSTTNIDLPEPILMRPGFSYEIRMVQPSLENICTRYPLKSEVKLQSGTIIKFHNKEEQGNEDPQRGIISCIILMPLCE